MPVAILHTWNLTLQKQVNKIKDYINEYSDLARGVGHLFGWVNELNTQYIVNF